MIRSKQISTDFACNGVLQARRRCLDPENRGDFGKFEFHTHASGAGNTFDTLALPSTQCRHIVVPVTAELCIGWGHIVLMGGGIDCIQHRPLLSL